MRFRSSREANLDHVYYPGSSSREFRFHHLVLEFLNLLIILSMLSNSSSIDLRLITEKQWKNLGGRQTWTQSLAGHVLLSSSCSEPLMLTECWRGAKHGTRCFRFVLLSRTQWYLHFINYRGWVTCQVDVAPSEVWSSILVSGCKAHAFSSHTASILFRFLELLALMLLEIPLLHYITYNSNNILIQLSIKNTFAYF